ncbi:MAG: hypothetical protein R3D32_09670 [Nitratireductor sp.]
MLADVDRSTASRLLRNIGLGSQKQWRGASLKVREVKGKGGRAGTGFEVAFNSLPADLKATYEVPAVPLAPLQNPVVLHPSGRKPRADRGGKRVLISRLWDAEIPLPDIAKQNIAADLADFRNSLWAQGMQFKSIREWCHRKLIQLVQARPITISEPELKRLCRIPKDWVLAGSHFRIVHDFRNNHREHERRAPIARRTIHGLKPMELVVADVHHLDIHFLRPDGSMATPKMIAWFDVATARIHWDLLLFEDRAGVRQQDVALSLLSSWTRRDFGCASRYQLDNGSEFQIVKAFQDAMKLTADFQSEGNRTVRAGISYSIAYNAKAKRIERWFRHLEEQFLSRLPGYIGGDRMNSRLKAPGKRVPPFDGTFADLCRMIGDLVHEYHETPIGGDNYRDRSPNEIYREFYDDGFRPSVFDPQFAFAIGCEAIPRTIKGSSFSLPGLNGRFYDDELTRHNGKRVWVHHSRICPDNPEVRVDADDKGTFLCIARLEQATGYLDQNAAKEAGRRRRLHSTAVRDLAEQAKTVDLIEEGPRLFGSAKVAGGEPGAILRINDHPAYQPQFQLPDHSPKPTDDLDDEDVRRRIIEEVVLKPRKW